MFLSFLLSILLASASVLFIEMAGEFFSSEKNIKKSRMLVFYSFIPYWASGVFYLVPKIGIYLVIVLSASLFYLLYLGLKKKLLQIPDKNIIKCFLLCSLGIIVLIVIRELIILVLPIII